MAKKKAAAKRAARKEPAAQAASAIKADTDAVANAPASVRAEQDKEAGRTDSQKEVRAYHEGDFQTTDPVTGEARDLDNQEQRVVRLDRGEFLEDLDK